MFNLMGQIVETFDVPNRAHHEINEKYPGGNLLVASNAKPISLQLTTRKI
jgi:hypothetical protein